MISAKYLILIVLCSGLQAIHSISEKQFLTKKDALAPQSSFLQIQNNLLKLGVLSEQIIKVLNKLSSGALKLKNEDLDVVNEQDQVIGQIDRNIAHEVGLFHRTTNIILISPNGEIILQQRAAYKSFPKHWTFFGGHVDICKGNLPAETCYLQGAVKELLEETNMYSKDETTYSLKKEIAARLIPIGVPGEYVYDIPGDKNKERRALYLFVLTKEEEQALKKEANELTRIRKRFENDEDKITAELKRLHDQEPGKWEVMNIRWETLNDVLARWKAGREKFTPDLFEYFFRQDNVKNQIETRVDEILQKCDNIYQRIQRSRQFDRNDLSNKNQELIDYSIREAEKFFKENNIPIPAEFWENLKIKIVVPRRLMPPFLIQSFNGIAYDFDQDKIIRSYNNKDKEDPIIYLRRPDLTYKIYIKERNKPEYMPISDENITFFPQDILLFPVFIIQETAKLFNFADQTISDFTNQYLANMGYSEIDSCLETSEIYKRRQKLENKSIPFINITDENTLIIIHVGPDNDIDQVSVPAIQTLIGNRHFIQNIIDMRYKNDPSYICAEQMRVCSLPEHVSDGTYGRWSFCIPELGGKRFIFTGGDVALCFSNTLEACLMQLWNTYEKKPFKKAIEFHIPLDCVYERLGTGPDDYSLVFSSYPVTSFDPSFLFEEAGISYQIYENGQLKKEKQYANRPFVKCYIWPTVHDLISYFNSINSKKNDASIRTTATGITSTESSI